MQIKTVPLIFCILLSVQLSAQKWSSNCFSFQLFDGDQQIDRFEALHGFEWGDRVDGSGNFELSILPQKGENFHRSLVWNNDLQVWQLYSMNIKEFRPVEYIKFSKMMPDSSMQTMTVFINFNYKSCIEGNCVKGIDVQKVVPIVFREGTYVMNAFPTRQNWENNNEVVKEIK